MDQLNTMTYSSSDETNSSSTEQSNTSSSNSDSSSDSTGQTSPSDSPPRQDAQPVASPARPRSNHDASYSATPPRRSKKRVPAGNKSRLGAIDEHSNIIAPDIPSRNPGRNRYRYAGASKFFLFGAYSRDSSVPPVGVYDDITGPRGEKFGDVRQNKPFQPPNRGGWRRLTCLGLIAFVVLLAIGLGVGLGIGLTRHKGNSSDTNDTPLTNPSLNTTGTQPFPLGTWSIPTYLTTTNTSCTSNPSTWRCFPYTTYTQSSPLTSLTTLTWLITSPTNSTLNLEISNSNPLFSYPFTNVPITFTDTNNNRLSAFSFTFPYRKQVVPNGDITGDGAATRCYYNNTVLSVRLYNTAEGAGGDVNITVPSTTTGAAEEVWPYAIEYDEMISEGPECFRYVNGTETDRVDVAAGSGTCACGYRNYGLN